MAIKVDDVYYSGSVLWPDARGEQLCSPLTDVRSDGRYGRWLYCKNCYKNVLPVSSYESIETPRRSVSTVQALCSECGWGLTPTVDA